MKITLEFNQYTNAGYLSDLWPGIYLVYFVKNENGEIIGNSVNTKLVIPGNNTNYVTMTLDVAQFGQGCELQVLASSMSTLPFTVRFEALN